MTAGLFAVLLAAPLLAAPFDEGSAIELRYSGVVNKVTRDADGTPVKRFTVYCVVAAAKDGQRQLAFAFEERGGGGWPWPERFGSVALDAAFKPKAAVPLRLLYDHEGTPTIIPLPMPLFAAFDQLKAGAEWTQGREAWEVVRQQKVQDRTCWQVSVTTNVGHKRTLWIETGSPLVVSCEERIFVGQGEEHSLKMQLESVKTLDDAQFARVQKPLASLLKLQSDLQRTGTESKPELTDTQIKAADDALPALEKEATDSPFGLLVAAISKDVKSQLQRSGEVAKLAGRFVGQTSPALSLKLLDRQPFDLAESKGKIVVLHFWEYQGEPLVEPYGQVGYLDFLFSKRRKLGVQVYGIAVDPRLTEPQTAAAALRSVQKLKGFMNLAYPLATDDGTLIGKFGDPRRVGAKLPLWVIITPDGKIAHYHVGFYKVNPDEGLRDLDEVLVKLIKEKKNAD